jgi:hypothetical protein
MIKKNNTPPLATLKSAIYKTRLKRHRKGRRAKISQKQYFKLDLLPIT